jgi:stearoyl-CoA 9-desaturase NADPH oxidoreductase
MPERGSQVALPGVARFVVRGLGYFTWPLRIDDYLELITPLWSVEERRGRIERVHRETADAVTVFITPGFRCAGHRPGQYVRLGFDVEGKRQWRAYSLSSDAARPDGQVTITVKRTEEGVVSRFLSSSQAAGSIVTLGDVEGEFTLPSPTPPKLLFLTAGSGITPVMAMLRSLSRQGDFPDVLHIHSARTQSEAIFATDLAALAERHDNYTVTQRATSDEGRLKPEALDEVCPDWRERETYACGPGAMLEAIRDHFDMAGVGDRLHMEYFEHMLLAGATGEGGTITFSGSDVSAECDGTTAILDAGENAGAVLPYGCRMGICHTCTGTLIDGSVRDLRTGDVTRAGTEIRTCVNSPDGDVTIEL